MCHMTQETTAHDFVIVRRSHGTKKAERHSAVAPKNVWVVVEPASPALMYETVLGNLCREDIHFDAPTIDAVRNVLNSGLDRDAFDRLRRVMDASTEDLSRVVGVPRRTLSRRGKFKTDESDRILRVASVFQRALEVCGNLKAARRWFATPKNALGNKTPLEFCDTGPGATEVERLLGRIEHGIFS